jgi:N-methylhydantoinase B
MSDQSTPTALASDLDPVTFSVLLNRLNSIVQEMTLTLELTAWSPLLALCRDFSCAIYDAQPRQLCMYDALPVHTTSMQLVLAEIADAFAGEIADGDVFLANAPHRSNTHIGDLVTATPVFIEGRHVFWSVTKGHQMDTGAMEPASVLALARNVWQEGIQIPPLRLVDAGAMRKDVLDLYLANVRYTELVHGDLLAQLGSINKGRQRLLEVCQEYGLDVVERYAEEILAYASRRMVAEIARIPPGRYEGETWVDTDAFERFHIPVKVTVTVTADTITADFSESGAQGDGGMNGSYATSQAAGAVAFLTYVDPEIPHNFGCLRHIEVVTRKGTICDARFPASTSVATLIPSDAMEDAVHRAMVTALPDRVLAGTYRNANIPTLTGVDEETEQPWGTLVFNGMGGQGAGKDTDGWPLFEYGAHGGLKVQPIEELELAFPLLVEQMEIEPDSMGLGEWIGGPGTRFAIRPVRGAMECFTSSDGVLNPPHGTLGGTPGAGGGQYVLDEPSAARTFVTGAGRVRVGADELWVGVSSGGGGYGHPCDRDAERVRVDVRDGLITRETARTVCGVALSADRDLRIDADETLRLRDGLRAADRPLIDPDAPGAAHWVEAIITERDARVVNPR